MDPLDAKTPAWTPYRYAFNNPLRFIDSNGMTEEEREKAHSKIENKKYGNARTNKKISKDMKTGINSDGSVDCSGYCAIVINSESDVEFKMPYGAIRNQKKAFIDAEKNGKAEYLTAEDDWIGLADIKNGDVVFTNEGNTGHGYVAFSDMKKGRVQLGRSSQNQQGVRKSEFVIGGYLTGKVVAIGRPIRELKLPDIHT